MLTPMYGALLQRIRTERGLTQRELAEVSGVDQPNISAIENDRRVPTIDTYARLLLACGYELAASAGDRVELVPLAPLDVPATPPRTMTDAERQAEVVTVLELSDVIVRAR